MGCSEIGVGGFKSTWDHGWVGFKSAWVALARHGPCVVMGPIWRELGMPRLESCSVILRRRRRAWLTTARRRKCGGLGRELWRALLRFGSPFDCLWFWIRFRISLLGFSTIHSLQLFFFYVEIQVWDRRLHWRKKFHNIPQILSL